MKINTKLLLFVLVLLNSFFHNFSLAQSPEKMSYQAVVRNNANSLVVHQNIGLKVTILQDSSNGTEVYSENHSTSTNENGLISIEIGSGKAISGIFSNIDWAHGPYFIKTEIDVNGGINYNISSISQLMSVPYALHSKTAERISDNQNLTNEIEEMLGCVFVDKFCTGDGSFSNPWKSKDGSAGIFDALRHLTLTKRIVYFKPGYYHTNGALEVDFSKLLPNLSDPIWKNTFSGYGIEFRGHNSSIYINAGSPLTGGKPGILFNWAGQHAFYWKFTGLQFYGVVDTALVQFGNNYDFPFNGCDFDIVANNGYVFPDYMTQKSPSSAVKICWALESRIHVVGVSATGSALELVTATFCTINGAFSNTLIPNTNRIYNNSLGLNLINCQSNTFTHMDLELTYVGIKFDQWTIQNTFSAIFVSYCDTTGATFDNSTQVTDGKNIVTSIRSGGTSQAPSSPIYQKLFTTNSIPSRTKIENFFGF